MSIHKAKGLEFPIVVLAGCQAGIESGHNADAEAIFDWSTGLTGVRAGSISDLAGLYIAEKWRRRSAEEQKRLLYVAMTRAREHLIISCAPSHRRANTSFLAMLDSALDGAIAAAASSRAVALGEGILEIEVVREDLAAPSRTAAKGEVSKKRIDWQPFLAAWSRRAARYEDVNRSAPFLTPTALKRREEISTEAGAAPARKPARQAPFLMVGDLAHRFLQRWNFASGVTAFERELHDWLAATLPRDMQSSAEEIENELQEIFAGFLRSSVYAELAGARMIAREIPLIMPWNGAIMEGVIDVIYEKNNLLYLADYKTDKIAASELVERAEHYRLQAEIYSRAVMQALRREAAAFKIIFLRLGKAVEFCFDKSQQLSLF